MMNDLFLLSIAGFAIILLLLVVVAFLNLKREQKKLKQAYQALALQIQRSGDDIVGLCSAAAAVDRRLSANEALLRDVQESIEIQQNNAEYLSGYDRDSIDEGESEQPQIYRQAIERIHSGATIDELVRACGMTRDEAVLLMRLHSPN
ncbi:hypothetical protein A1359_01815 [Methylomonas lenta]|uniref:DUF2802 domain-containing protein n=2 Tax=Methylomonas lenta TaxID=980561 RepID=A0A177MYL0_9GAMM|nr:hypothetical protein A1359_01815 [Methylomonas lenta]